MLAWRTGKRDGMIFALDPSDPAGRQLAMDAKVIIWHIGVPLS